MRKTLVTLTLAMALLVIPVVLRGHHGYASFDTRKEVTLKGTVTDFHFVNPHSIVEFDVKNDKGKVVQWQGELTSPSHLAPKGWNRTTLQAGDEVAVTGYLAKNGVAAIWIEKIKMADGKDLHIDDPELKQLKQQKR